jgi:hypothetical protein
MFVLLLVLMPAMATAQNRVVHLESNIPGAIVLVDGTYVGRIADSPFKFDESVQQVLLRSPRITAWNAESILVDIPDGEEVRLRADFSMLRPMAILPSPDPVMSGLRSAREDRLVFSQPEPGRRRWIDVVSLSGAVVAGALAVHFRTKADNRFEDWEADKQLALKRDIQRLDVLSGVSTGVMQVGIGVFAFRLVF